MSVQTPGGIGPTSGLGSPSDMGTLQTSVLPPQPPPPLVQNNTVYIDGHPACAVNGTPARVYTESVSAPPPPPYQPPPPKDLGPIEFKSAKADVKVGSAEASGNVDDTGAGEASAGYGSQEGTISRDSSGNWDWGVKGKKDKPDKDKKKKKKIEVNGEVCIKKKNGRKDGKGSWFNYEWQFAGVHNSVGLPDGDFCVGAGPEYASPDWNYGMGTPEK